ncbi:flavin-containing monooxygenase [Mycolicibacterium diernhoferi]|uniref:FAD-dependent oxidoreductase n=1 Tax=Mycolicibacterium diernhoferi TaxID=1801 RepID=A0A1Q4HC38_9MYCO|nr:NAD(P)/FAD-dependent oxidoreductase [Mycolicibacterium diernhoferi]OJZ65106.1 FAD-dependent oxidoreductase [Mycolicibacterium diernhoferi]OPE53058.1 FAD-dependent oxidoreductase [Mycolicibacterium diernhoferi]PEG55035.1 NAD(P)/FAD-dependent oxidoreductase [Mycolicibacterium diernhoferi]QYL23682.1 NAD(P)/FAD-dependent oxidoreductase [Mycolicibacterium diernhoferi]
MSQLLEPGVTLDADELRDALAEANVPCLIGVLYQLTGDARWLAEPYRITPTMGFESHDDGGLPAERVEEIRSAAFTAITDWSAGAPVAYPAPDGAELVALMSAVMGEPVAEKYVPLAAEQLGFAPFVADDVTDRCADTGFSVIVVGAGFSGLAAAVHLKQAGIPFRVLERNDHVGGTWYEANYPGARVDVPNDLYSYSFFHREWSQNFAQPDEIRQYIDDVIAHFDLAPHIETGVSVDGAEWDADGSEWVVKINSGNGSETIRATALITAAGLHNTPNIPQFPGLSEFTGEVLHSARWSPETDLRGKKVAVVGAGASAMQVVCKIAEDVEQMVVVQREPHWTTPNEQYFRKQTPARHWLYRNVPFYRAWFRFRLYWIYTERNYPALRVDPKAAEKGKLVSGLNDAYRRNLTAYLRAQLDGREDLIEKSLPKYPPFGKRLLMDNGWFATLRRPNVSLVAEGVDHLTERGLVTDSGETFDVDILILCTGFQQQRYLYPMELRGRDGVELRESWSDDNARAYLGITAPGFPNLFFLYGPNTNPPGGSWLTVAEAQVRYVVEMLTEMVKDDVATVEVREEPFEDYNRELDDTNNAMVYAMDGVESYYRNSTGRVVTNSPWAVPDYFARTSAPNLADYDVTPR